MFTLIISLILTVVFLLALERQHNTHAHSIASYESVIDQWQAYAADLEYKLAQYENRINSGELIYVDLPAHESAMISLAWYDKHPGKIQTLPGMEKFIPVEKSNNGKKQTSKATSKPESKGSDSTGKTTHESIVKALESLGESGKLSDKESAKIDSWLSKDKTKNLAPETLAQYLCNMRKS